MKNRSVGASTSVFVAGDLVGYVAAEVVIYPTRTFCCRKDRWSMAKKYLVLLLLGILCYFIVSFLYFLIVK